MKKFSSIRSRLANGYVPPVYSYDDNSDDGYDAAKDDYLTGDGPAITKNQRQEVEADNEEYRRYRYERGL